VKILASLALLLGIAHIGFGVAMFRAYNLELIWFIGAGLAMVVVALNNLTSATILKMRLAQNLIMTAYVAMILSLAPEPQVILGLVLFSGLASVSLIQVYANKMELSPRRPSIEISD